MVAISSKTYSLKNLSSPGQGNAAILKVLDLGPSIENRLGPGEPELHCKSGDTRFLPCLRSLSLMKRIVESSQQYCSTSSSIVMAARCSNTASSNKSQNDAEFQRKPLRIIMNRIGNVELHVSLADVLHPGLL
jgi:hypothetical protein